MKPELSGFEYNKDFMASVKNLNQGEVGKLNPWNFSNTCSL